jgi:hypothetical protein
MHMHTRHHSIPANVLMLLLLLLLLLLCSTPVPTNCLRTSVATLRLSAASTDRTSMLNTARTGR